MCEISMIIIVKQNRADLSELIVNHSLFALFAIRATHCLLHVKRANQIHVDYMYDSFLSIKFQNQPIDRQITYFRN